MRLLQCRRCNEAFAGHYTCCPDCLGGLVPLNPKRHKYGAKAVDVDGIRFASKKEANRWFELKTMLASGMISELKRQVAFDLVVNGIKVAKYISDFVYVEDGAQIVEDAKGVRTAMFRLKAKLLKACHGIEVKLT